jgi:hypothetical protein
MNNYYNHPKDRRTEGKFIDELFKPEAALLRAVLFTLVGAIIGFIVLEIADTEIQTKTLFPFYCIASIAILPGVFGLYLFTRKAKNNDDVISYVALILMAHIIFAPLITHYFVLPEDARKCASATGSSVSWVNNECVYSYTGKMVDDSFNNLRESHVKTRDDNNNVVDTTVYTGRKLDGTEYVIKVRDNKIIESTIDNSLVGSQVYTKHGELLLVTKRKLKAPLHGARDPKEGFCYHGNLYEYRNYSRSIEKAGACPSDRNYANMEDQ